MNTFQQFFHPKLLKSQKFWHKKSQKNSLEALTVFAPDFPTQVNVLLVPGLT
jgi:hypothetical protein